MHRPNLSSSAALRIAEFVADSFIQKFSERADIDPETVAALGGMVRDKLRKDQDKGLAPDDPHAALNPEALKIAARQAETLAGSGKLSPQFVLSSVGEGVTPLVVACLARLADLPVNAVADVVRTASPKGMLAVAWAGDFSAEDAVQLQLKVARVTPDAVIRPRAGGGFDCTEAELEWQLDMFKDLARGKTPTPA